MNVGQMWTVYSVGMTSDMERSIRAEVLPVAKALHRETECGVSVALDALCTAYWKASIVPPPLRTYPTGPGWYHVRFGDWGFAQVVRFNGGLRVCHDGKLCLLTTADEWGSTVDPPGPTTPAPKTPTDGVAQMEEQPASNRQAAGSSPAIITGRPGPHGASGAGSTSHSAMLVWMQLPDDRKWAAAEVEHGRYTGPYDTKAKALEEHPMAKVVARIAATADPVHVLMGALDIGDLACAASELICDEFGAEDPEVDIGHRLLSELEDLVRPVLTDWVTRHDVKTAYFKIDPETIERA